MDTEDAAGRTLTVRSPAKINWALRVVRRRDDGYHDIESLVTPVSLFDELTFSARERPGIELSCDTGRVPLDANNLIARAAEALAREAGLARGVRCRLVKRIPIGGGLGGGSSNAASTLVALNRLWGLGWPTARLAVVAARVGSDVPLFLAGGPVIMRGRGEHVEPARPGWDGWIVLVFPGVEVSTAAVYREWRAGESAGTDLARFADRPADAREWMGWTFNMLEPPAMRVCPALTSWARRLAEVAGRPVRVSGSGSTLFTAFDEQFQADDFAAAAREQTRLETCVVRPIAPRCRSDG
ncbi:MAG: 4-diphosphocytidyl-2-C-methyl-D-erythritol kinase [Phycisphaerae bacterium]